MTKPILYRKRLIPEETILLKDDKITFIDPNKIITKWQALKPRTDFSHGYSCYYINEGVKISKVIKEDGNLLYYYCDIIQTDYNPIDRSFTFTDLLFDLIVYEDGRHKILDIEEGALALKNGIATSEQICYAMETLGKLLNIFYSGNFHTLTDPLNN